MQIGGLDQSVGKLTKLNNDGGDKWAFDIKGI